MRLPICLISHSQLILLSHLTRLSDFLKAQAQDCPFVFAINSGPSTDRFERRLDMIGSVPVRLSDIGRSFGLGAQNALFGFAGARNLF